MVADGMQEMYNIKYGYFHISVQKYVYIIGQQVQLVGHLYIY